MPALAASNQRVRRLRRLSGRRSARAEAGAFILEGPTLVAEALASGVPLEGVYLDADAPDLDDVRAAAAAGAVPVHEVAPGVLAGITDSVTPRPIIAVAPIPASHLDTVVGTAVRTRRPVLVLVDVRDPGNLGTIIRVADASGVAGVICCRGTVDPWSPKVVRSSAGSVLNTPIVHEVDPDSVFSVLAEARVPTVGTRVEGGSPYDTIDLAGAVAVVLGNEAHGLPDHLGNEIDIVATIPMEGRAESLNVAMAASVLCFEALRQRRVSSGQTEQAPRTDWTTPPPSDKVIRP